MLEQYERDAVIARQAFENGDTNYKALIEIYSGRKSSHLLLIKQAYQTKFKRQLDQDIINSEPPHPYQRILAALATSHKSHHTDVSQHVAKCDAKRLYETGEGRAGAIEEAVVLEIFSKRSIPQLRLTFSTYKHIYGHEYTKSLKKETYGEFEDALRTVVKCMYTPSNYYAKMLHASIKGTITDKTVLTRVMISRAEIDLDEIQTVFKYKFGMELRNAICESIKSDENQRDFFVALTSIHSL
ncbi:Annexin [Macleaya cordata]|uniref:Annexin n=1 Tax=Macleaya cordata TaxID=56857 RepID=A0A200QPA3_MACCD|nr:Annexin [Macleaya cordata]